MIYNMDFHKYSKLTHQENNHLTHGNHKNIKCWTIFDTLTNNFRNVLKANGDNNV